MLSRPVLTVVTYNVFGGGKFKDLRKKAIVNEIIGNNSKTGTEEPQRPDIICLQEATDEIIDAVLDALDGEYHTFTKLECLDPRKTNPEDLAMVKEGGFLAIISRFPMLAKEVVHAGGWLEDGILKCSVQVDVPQDSAIENAHPSIKKVSLTIYNYHGSGGTFGKPMEVILRKRNQRIDELKVLHEDVEKELAADNLQRGASPIVLIAGDFNSDCHDVENFPESAGFPEKVLDGKALNGGEALGGSDIRSYDLWTKIHKSPEGGHTESHKHNKFRAWLKPKQNREATFDRIVVAHRCRGSSGGENSSRNAIYLTVEPLAVELMGDRKIKTLLVNGGEVAGSDAAEQSVDVFPSDHFGLVAYLLYAVV